MNNMMRFVCGDFVAVLRGGMCFIFAYVWAVDLGTTYRGIDWCTDTIDIQGYLVALIVAVLFACHGVIGNKYSWAWLMTAAVMAWPVQLADRLAIIGDHCVYEETARLPESLLGPTIGYNVYLLLPWSVRPGPDNPLAQIAKWLWCRFRGKPWPCLGRRGVGAHYSPQRVALPVVIFYWMFLFGWAYPPLVGGALTRDPQFYLAALLPTLALIAHLMSFTRASWWGVVGSLLPACLIQVATRLHYVQPFAASSFRVQEARLIPVLFLVFLALALLIRPETIPCGTPCETN